MPVRGFLSHLDLNVTDPSASIPFYEVLLDCLGFQRTDLLGPDRASWRLIGLEGFHFEIEIRTSPQTARSGGHRRSDAGIDHVAFHAESRADVDVIFGELTEAGYIVDEPPRTYDYSPGYYAIGFDDPDGIRLEVVFDPETNP